MKRKLVRSNCTTAQVVAALTKHPTWVAEASYCSRWVEMTARFFDSQVIICYPNSSVRTTDKRELIPLRSDWSIYRPVKRRKVLELAKFTSTTRVASRLFYEDHGNELVKQRTDPSKTYRLLLAEVDE